ncbi:ABC transporter substrate-binding protein [Olsenella uli]|uniref:ABC transporter substrate-binding protein n=1 Tax=Olsenella uli TaxID=133926 RepID=UPI00045266EC|nr:ABC transporter substrate-binding protein [Olsenella uli]EUB30440.1 NMT1/THI5-like protein [Olsenella uli MSTE5]
MRENRIRRLHAAAVAAVAAVLSATLVACGGQAAPSGQPADTDARQSEAVGSVDVKVASLKGPTSIGLASFMDKAASDPGSLANAYDFTVAGSADEVVPSLIQGDVDIALVPANVASVLYNKTAGGVVALDVNTLGVLSVVTADSGVVDFSALSGRTVYMTGKGATPEYVMNYLLERNGLAGQVTLEFKSEATEVVQAISQDLDAVAVLPQPYVTVACAKNPSLKATIDLNDVWDAASADGSRLVTGVTVARREFLEGHPDAVREFVERQSASVDAANADPEGTAPLVVNAGIVDSEQIAAKAIPGCHLVCLTGDDLRGALSGYLKTLFDADASSVGGSLPGDDFYYAG